jgi:transposase
LVTQQHITISRSRETEQRLHSEIHKLRKSNVEIQQKADALASQAAIEAKTIQDFSVQIAALKNQLEAKTLGYEKERSER